MAKNEKATSITAEELKNLQELINTVNRAQLELGGLESRKHSLAHQVLALQGQVAEMQKGFEETYGKVDINVTDGTISYREDEQADKED
jgi:uncharacterized protein HemX|tara:strand:- start:25 stop:291 length:267 start_codon:yes stop_codon:yes gene_type:complete